MMQLFQGAYANAVFSLIWNVLYIYESMVPIKMKFLLFPFSTKMLLHFLIKKLLSISLVYLEKIW